VRRSPILVGGILIHASARLYQSPDRRHAYGNDSQPRLKFPFWRDTRPSKGRHASSTQVFFPSITRYHSMCRTAHLSQIIESGQQVGPVRRKLFAPHEEGLHQCGQFGCGGVADNAGSHAGRVIVHRLRRSI